MYLCDYLKPVKFAEERDSARTTWQLIYRSKRKSYQKKNHHHHQSLFIHEIVSFYMVFLGIVFKTRLKYSKELLTIMLKIQKLTL